MFIDADPAATPHFDCPLNPLAASPARQTSSKQLEMARERYQEQMNGMEKKVEKLRQQCVKQKEALTSHKGDAKEKMKLQRELDQMQRRLKSLDE